MGERILGIAKYIDQYESSFENENEMKKWRKERGLSSRPMNGNTITNKDKINQENVPSGSTEDFNLSD